MTIHSFTEAAYKAAERSQARLLTERTQDAFLAHCRASQRWQRLCLDRASGK